jgi:hypothetical protein
MRVMQIVAAILFRWFETSIDLHGFQGIAVSEKLMMSFIGNRK